MASMRCLEVHLTDQRGAVDIKKQENLADLQLWIGRLQFARTVFLHQTKLDKPLLSIFVIFVFADMTAIV